MPTKFFGSKLNTILLLILAVLMILFLMIINKSSNPNQVINTSKLIDVKQFKFKITRPFIDQKYIYDYFIFQGMDPAYNSGGCVDYVSMDYDFKLNGHNIVVILKGETNKTPKSGVPCVDLPVYPGFSERLDLTNGNYNLTIKNKDLIDEYLVNVEGENIQITAQNNSVFSEPIITSKK